MRLVTNKALVDFAAGHREAGAPLPIWRRIIERGTFANFAELNKTFDTVDKAGDFFVVDIGGNKFRLVAAVHFNRRMVFIRQVFTHKEYDQWTPRSTGEPPLTWPRHSAN